MPLLHRLEHSNIAVSQLLHSTVQYGAKSGIVYLSQRDFAAFLAISLRCAGVSALALAVPPLRPPRLPAATARGLLRCSPPSASFPPMACSTTRRAFVAKSSSLRLVMEPSCHESGAVASPKDFKPVSYTHL